MTGSSGIRSRAAMIAFGVVVVAVVAVFVGYFGLRTPPVAAQQVADDSAVVARVDGEAITENDLTAAVQEFRDQLAQIKGDPRAALIDLVVNIRLAAKAALAAAMDQDPQVAAQLALVRDRTLYSEYLRGKFVAAVTEEAGRKRFDEELAKFVPGEEMHVRHILVKTEEEARAVIAELDNGGDFAELAKAKSIDEGSAVNGGDLDFIGRGQTVKPFEDAAFALEVAQYTKTPVQSQYGWHVIQLEAKRPQAPPVFENEARRLQQELFTETFDKAMEELRSAATIEVVPVAEPETPAKTTPETTPEAAPEASPEPAPATGQ